LAWYGRGGRAGAAEEGGAGRRPGTPVCLLLELGMARRGPLRRRRRRRGPGGGGDRARPASMPRAAPGAARRAGGGPRRRFPCDAREFPDWSRMNGALNGASESHSFVLTSLRVLGRRVYMAATLAGFGYLHGNSAMPTAFNNHQSHLETKGRIEDHNAYGMQILYS